MDFLERLLPQSGWYCTAKLNPKGGFQHFFFENLDDVKKNLQAQDAKGATMYLAQASFKSNANRKGENAHAFRNFFMDIDCGPEKYAKDPQHSYPTQGDALIALRTFLELTHLPTPSIVNSGNGLYAHWLLDQDLPAEKWRALARILKKLTEHHGFKADPMRTADAASVLRPVGTTNRKGAAKPVRLVVERPVVEVQDLISLLEAAATKAKIDTPALQVPTKFKGLNDEFTAGIEGPPASAEKIATKCAQIRELRDTQGNVSEPVWYAAIGLLRYCTEGEELIHEWSQGHPDYTPAATAKKIAQHEASGTGPTTCAKFGADNPTGCLACGYANTIKSPIVLGRPELVPLQEAEEEDESVMPTGYTRTKDGLFFQEESGVQTRFHSYDLYPVALAHDASLGYETVTIRHQVPTTLEYAEFAIRSALVHDQKMLLMTLADNSVQVSGSESRKIMVNYLDKCMVELRKRRALATLHSQMGWRVHNKAQAFVLGNKVSCADGMEETTGFARNIPEVAKAFTPQGDLKAWRDATKCFSLPGMEPLTFAFLAGAFGAPLMRFTGFAGAVVALVGRSGIGKTLAGEFVLSTYGDPERLTLLKNDTTNALVSRLGLYGSLPLYLDEVSNIEGQDLSDLLYRVTQGRDKARLHRSGAERGVLNQWNTIAVASSNHSLVDKLSNLKADASAEINRIMEVSCTPVPAFGRDLATKTWRVFHANYGTAGPAYVKHLVEHYDDHREKIDTLSARIDALSGAASEERFWSAISGAALYGGLLAQKLGIIDFPVAPLLPWVVDQIKDLRENKHELVSSQVDVLGQFLDENTAGVLITSHDSDQAGHVCSIIKEPRGALVARIMVDKGTAYISRAALKRHLERTYGSYTELKNDLSGVGALISANARKVLGGGTYIGGTQQPVWQVDLNCPALGRKVMRVVRSITEGKVEEK